MPGDLGMIFRFMRFLLVNTVGLNAWHIPKRYRGYEIALRPLECDWKRGAAIQQVAGFFPDLLQDFGETGFTFVPDEKMDVVGKSVDCERKYLLIKENVVQMSVTGVADIPT